MRSELDHIVIVSPRLADGVEFVRRTLGVTPQVGGAHPTMGTHNCLLRLGDKTYLEVISIDPDAPRPARARWFGLDALPANFPPRLAAWVARTDDIESAAAAASTILGKITPMSRGPLHWRITICDDGRPPMHGIAPSVIEWPSGVHPTDKMPDSGCTLLRLEAFHPDAAQAASLLKAIGFNGEYRVSPLPAGRAPHLVAHIQTPAGARLLGAGH